MIYGECDLDGTTVLNVRWPHQRVWKVWGTTEGGETVEVYVLDDCEGDAIESTLEWVGGEGSDDSGLHVSRVHGDDLGRVLAAVNAANAT
jgi:hypothetical protein